jgi:ankyrin repeat protein
MLVDKGADVNAKSKNGNKAFDVAKKMDHLAIMNILKPLTYGEFNFFLLLLLLFES